MVDLSVMNATAAGLDGRPKARTGRRSTPGRPRRTAARSAEPTPPDPASKARHHGTAAKTAIQEDRDQAALTAMQRQMVEQLALLRAQFQEAVASYSVRVQGVLTQIDDVLSDDPGDLSAEERRNRARALRRAAAELGDLDLKPAKGRRRDLKSIETFVRDLGEAIANW
jgi:hypothetical protein